MSDFPWGPAVAALTLFVAGCSGDEGAAQQDPSPQTTSSQAPSLGPSAAKSLAAGSTLGPTAGPTSQEPSSLPGTDVALDAPNLDAPDRPLASMDLIEDYSEEVADRLVGMGDKLRRRDFDACEEWLGEDFVGHSIAGLPLGKATPLPLGTQKLSFDVTSPIRVNRQGFLDALKEHMGPWQHVDSAIWKVKAAEFQAGGRTWGRVRLKLTVLGTDAQGGPTSLTAWGHGRAAKRKREWYLDAFGLESFTTIHRAQRVFTDVAVPAGVAHAGIRFGQPGNTSFAWNGAAAGDVDGDGRFDLFVPSSPKPMLYMANGRDGFDEEAAQRGIDSGGGTGAVFFDFDNDGDQDLAVGDVGWKEGDGATRGHRLRLYVNDGKGVFTESGNKLGFDTLCHAYTLVVLDADLDGFLDVFVCNYGRVENEPNDSWIQATNGSSNIFLHNEGGKGFRDATAEFGFEDSGWSYAAAAADYDADGDIDLYVANDYGRNALWRNEGGRFTEVAEDEGTSDLGNGMGAAFGDLNNDGQLDLYVSNMSSTAGNRILRRLSEESGTADLVKMAAGNSIFTRTDGGFERLDPARGGIGASWAWSPALCDLNLDGRLDMYCASGFVTGDTLEDT